MSAKAGGYHVRNYAVAREGGEAAMSEGRFRDIFAQVQEALANLGGAKETETGEMLSIKVRPERLIESIGLLAEKFGIRHLTTITGVDAGAHIELNYHFWYGNRVITIKTAVPKTNVEIQSLVPTVPGAILYEMEVHDLFGVRFPGNPWMNKPLLLPENYPADLPPPLLKETSPETIRKSLGLEKQ
jgi:NADH:ubiquinone oxidoreductase subunit C